MRVTAILFAALVMSVAFVATAAADCESDCIYWLNECRQTCSQCLCEFEYESCLASCHAPASTSEAIMDTSCQSTPDLSQASCNADLNGTESVCASTADFM